MNDETSPCRNALDWLQRRLDGDSAAMPASVASHVTKCADCRGRIRAAELLLASLEERHEDQILRPLARVHVIAVVQRDARLRRIARWTTAGAAIAAAVMVAAWLANRIPEPGPTPNPIAQLPQRAPSLRAGLASAQEAVASLTRRTASETIGESRLLLPNIEIPKSATTALASAAAPIGAAGRGVADGLEPVASSARRAVNLFLGDRPQENDDALKSR
jgi:hypothetical protein